jgi:hypothetical protein
MPCVESFINDKRFVHQVQCKICTYVEVKKKLQTLKLNSLFKHVGQQKCKASMPKVDASSYYYNKDLVC